MIEILKASAGSGKTWNLARYYIRLMLESKDPFSYRHILAVTFTNKATDEMKDRILKELHILAKNPAGSDYYGDFVPALFPDARALSVWYKSFNI
jgi:ATP-dependent exoDNAse (exonuclease V) beta subunit